jgi:hypothetical protein
MMAFTISQNNDFGRKKHRQQLVERSTLTFEEEKKNT